MKRNLRMSWIRYSDKPFLSDRLFQILEEFSINRVASCYVVKIF